MFLSNFDIRICLVIISNILRNNKNKKICKRQSKKQKKENKKQKTKTNKRGVNSTMFSEKEVIRNRVTF